MPTVAILEDQRLMRDALVEVLASEGFSVTCASGSPEEVLSSVRARPVDLALVDLFLGGEAEGDEPRGLEVLREVRRWAPEIKSVILSGTYDERLMDRAYSAGAVAYLDKNASSLEQLTPSLRQVLAGERIFPLARLFSSSPRAENPILATLTTREREVLAQVSTGADNLQISARLGISERTVRAHISALYRKMDAANRTELALTARKLGVHAPHGT